MPNQERHLPCKRAAKVEFKERQGGLAMRQKATSQLTLVATDENLTQLKATKGKPPLPVLCTQASVSHAGKDLLEEARSCLSLHKQSHTPL